MEKVKPIPFYKRFSLRVFLFNAILLFSIIVPTTIIRRMDYKQLMDRISFHTAFFYYCTDRLSGLDESDWPGAIEKLPGIFYQQRICIFSFDKKLIYDSGIMRKFDGSYAFKPLLPDPYIHWEKENKHLDPDVYISSLRNINLDNVDPERVFQSTRTVRYKDGLDRIILSGEVLHSADGKGYIFTLSHSLVDILIHGRSVKERFLFLYSIAALFSIILTIVLSWSVTNPLKRLYTYSRGILQSRIKEDDFTGLPERGEIGDICRALRNLIRDQKRQSENFMRFSSDIVHELKTPLAAIRSGLEIYSESSDGEEKEELYDRINGKIRQMENLMNEIRFIGSIESNTAEERCEKILSVFEDIFYEFGGAEIETEIGEGMEDRSLPVSCEKLYQILQNLLKNAVSFSPVKGSVSLSLRIEEDFLVIRVSDKGPGIREEVFPHITNRFFSYRPEGGEKHSGLGLSIIDAIVRGCGGRLEYRNGVSGGAEFTCRIPAYRNSALSESTISSIPRRFTE